MTEDSDRSEEALPATFSDKRRNLRYRLNALRLAWSRSGYRRRRLEIGARPVHPGVAPDWRSLIDGTIEKLRLRRPPVLAGDAFSSHLLRDDIHRLLSAMNASARAHGLRLAIFLSPRDFRIMPFARERRAIRRATHSASLHLALIDEENRLCFVHELIPWKTDGDGFIAVADDVPHKRIRRPVDPGAAAAVPANDDITPAFPVDAVYTWVDSADPEWRHLYTELSGGGAINTDRFSQRNELRYSLRSLDLYAPWLRRIFIFSNCRPPAWFHSSERHRWVRHEDVIETRHLPTFNSHAIETFLHRIPELSDHFVYLNDDVLLFDWARASDFFDATGRSVCQLEPYGIVYHHQQLVAEGLAKEWQHASVNGAKLLYQRFGRYPLRLHRHVPFALSRAVYENIEAEFRNEMEATRANRFRDVTDISFTSFFYHHYALFRGLAVPGTATGFLINSLSFHRFVKELRRRRRFHFICVNDGGDSASDPTFSHFKDRILPLCFPFGSGAECRYLTHALSNRD